MTSIDRKAGLRFEDPGLHLLVLDAVESAWTDDGVPSIPAELRALLDDVEASVESLPAFVSDLVAFLHTVPIDREAASNVTSLDVEYRGGLYEYIETASRADVDGSDDPAHAEQGRDPYATTDWMTAFEVRSLEGVESLESLESLEWSATDDCVLDLSPLARHPALVTVTLSGRCANIAVLETLPRLRRVYWNGAQVDDPSIVERLRGRVQFL